jgi:hypothetical protein
MPCLILAWRATKIDPQELGLINGVQPSERPFHETATPEEWIRESTKWADSHDPNMPALPIEAVSREIWLYLDNLGASFYLHPIFILDDLGTNL